MSTRITNSTADTPAPAPPRHADSLLAQLFHDANAPMLVWDPQFRISHFNFACEALTGRRADEVIGASLELLFPPDHVAEAMQRVRTTLAGERGDSIQILVQHRDGSTRTVLWNVATLFAPDGKTPVATLAQGCDVTARKQAEKALAQEHELLLGVLDNIPDEIYLKATDSRFLAANPVAIRFLGLATAEAIVGKSDFDFFPREVAATYFKEEQAIMHGGQPLINREGAGIDAAGRRRWVWTTKVPLRDHTGAITGLLGINRDITTRKEAEEALRQLNAELEQRVAERTTELRRAVEQLQARNEAKGEFVSNVSHELRTPLASIAHALENMRCGILGPLNERMTAYVAMMEEDCQRLKHTVTDLLDLDRMEGNRLVLHRRKVHIGRLVQRLTQALRRLAERKGHCLEVRTDRAATFVEGDVRKLDRVIMNLVDNAVKYTPDGGRVTLTLRREAAEGDSVILNVVDNGIGIEPQHLERVTERYYRVGEHVTGAGLGLALCKDLVELHGGTLTLASPPIGQSHGTEVSVTLPASNPPRILAVDDMADVRDVLRHQLTAGGYVPVCAASGLEALEVLHGDSPPDLMIVDILMPGLSGFELIARARTEPPFRMLPILAITGEELDAEQHAMLTGFGVALLTKPWRQAELLAHIEDLTISPLEGQ